MNIDFKLDFLYYQEEGILDGVDPKMQELYPHINKFGEFINMTSISDLLQLLCISYKKEYCQEHYWFDQFMIEGAYKIRTIYPDDLDEEIDLYLPEEKMVRDDLQYLAFKMFNDINRNASFVKEIVINFKESQNYLAIAQSIEDGLEGVSFTREDILDETIFIVLNSPIANIMISTDSFKMVINENKWIKYFG
ncbi:hypothetical protein GCM10011344_24980 [Dokdonia pacifica]|uniref:Uncharacterized protein n=1 Tax=Dokdonia pacifica TaxID=1627892 RepID=A0A238WQC8_9FLAO|nr:hypothetical protein [Dokdonia pacifica]GGG23246.1 hypothetical protein GCM10011344_24980 [Dokdonia pacifica]SNR48756.1 hypothetical protein SAMN06265376_1011328 [Dokdonia pacifica]